MAASVWSFQLAAQSIELKTIQAGSFTMGADAQTLTVAQVSGNGASSDRHSHGDFDEVPAHKVTLAHAFKIATHLVSVEEYRKFDPQYAASVAHPEYASGISYEQAVKFCAWLSKKEGKPYRLPTEAEWEYVARAGHQTPYSSGDLPLAAGKLNEWGVAIAEGTPEWVADWYGSYTAAAVTDPTGPAKGYFRVVRGAGLDSKDQKSNKDAAAGVVYPAMDAYFLRSANRASMAPSYAAKNGNIGFRVVQAPMPKANPTPVTPLLFATGVTQTAADFTKGPDPTKPFYRVHEVFPRLGTKSMPEVGWKLGLASGIGINYHNSAVQVLDNGDVVAAYYNTPDKEDDPDQTILIMRRRAGAEDWDMPEPWPYFADVANAAPVFWNERGKLWLFWGFPRLIGAPPFAYTRSADNGVTWEPVQFPHFPQPIGRYVSQPINSVVRAKDGTIYIPTDSTGKDADGNGSVSAVWATKDEGKTWYDTGGRTAGRHTTLVIAKNGDLLGYGGKNSNIEGRMPLATSTDGGKTWTKSKTPFDVLASGERPSVIRLVSGRLFFVADCNPKVQKHIHKDGAYVALSDDDGKTWKQKKLPDDVVTVGYTTSTQGPDGTIHVVSSKNTPNDYEIELNEAWILSDAGVTPAAEKISGAVKHTERWPNGKLKATWSAGRADDGRVLLEGAKTIYNEAGRKQWTAEFHLGRKTGTEVFYRADGSKQWEKSYTDGGRWTWKQFDAAGKVTAESTWKGKTLVEP
ncbi:MAG: SUMF1/EgtB/PvdO family nonheme iron enzyme [Terracidiphilus sp.]|nr:SUMF1/EgtB/PvdO family nonheme iron enzyme [Terracidiphilus sp.]